MILTGLKILQEKNIGNIVISPFNHSQLNPNSYNLTLGDTLKVYTGVNLDMKKDNPYKEIVIPKSGLLLYPNKFYLGGTVEYTETRNLVPVLEGRSSLARLGIEIHSTAGFGDIGFCGNWTLEISCKKSVIIYPFVEICQIYYLKVDSVTNEVEEYENYSGKYQGDKEITTSKMWMELENKED